MIETVFETRPLCAACNHDDVCGLNPIGGSLRMQTVTHQDGSTCGRVAHEGCIAILRAELAYPPDDKLEPLTVGCPCSGGLIAGGVDVTDRTPSYSAPTGGTTDYYDPSADDDSDPFGLSENEADDRGDTDVESDEGDDADDDSEQEEEEEEDEKDDEETEEDVDAPRRTARPRHSDGWAMPAGHSASGEDRADETLGPLRDDASFSAQTWRGPDEAADRDGAD
jgi:hypothetical protein